MRFADISIRIKLVAACIVIGIVPLMVAGSYGNWLVTNSLIEKSFDKLMTIQSLRKNQVEASFKRFFDDLETLSTSQRLRNMIDDLEGYRRQINVPSSTPFLVQSGQYRTIVDKYRSSYLEYLNTYGYHDMKVISSLSGHVLFSVAEERDLGANLIYGRYKDSSLAAVWREVVNTGKIAVVDFTSYEPSNGMQSLFIGSPIYNNTGMLESIVVLQLGPSFINAIMNGREGMGETGESYLVRWFMATEKFEFRSNVQTMGEGKYNIGYKMAGIPQYWMDAVNANFEKGSGLYLDSETREVLVAYDSLDIPGIEWYQISKIHKQEIIAPLRQLLSKALPLTFVLCLFIIGCAWIFSRRIVRPVIADVEFAKAISEGNLDASIDLQQKDELGVLAMTLNEMAVNLRETDWLKRGKEGLDTQLRGEADLEIMGSKFISFIVSHMDGQIGAFYLFQDNMLELVATHAFTDRNGNFNRFHLGEGLVGQATLERRLIVFSNVKDVTPEYNYGIDQQPPDHFMVAPFVLDGKIIGAFLIGSFQPFSLLHRKFVEQNLESVAILIDMARSRQTIEELYEQAQGQQDELLVVNKGLEAQTRALKKSEAELQSQQEELRVTNEELEERTEALQKSQAELQAQQEELRVTNEDLQERTDTLEKQKAALRQKTSELIKTRKEVEKKAEELERGSKYKSEFLANMSHELRTPLNSILILSQILAANKPNNLDEKQIESAKAINSSGSELLTLINEILDLSKVEAGKIELYYEEVEISRIVADVKRLFKDIADEKKLVFDMSFEDNLPKTIYTDGQRVQQILRNLLTNAFKFTHSGKVSLTVSRPLPTSSIPQDEAQKMIAFAVKDEGIGIPLKQQEEIFKAFQQADGSTSRTYGGTGLGLSISKELTRLLGGTIYLESSEGHGSTFTFVLPQNAIGKTNEGKNERQFIDVYDQPELAESQLPGTVTEQDKENSLIRIANDGSDRFDPNDKVLLIIEDDKKSARIISDCAKEHGFRYILAESGEKGLHYADYYRPSAIILDIGLPGIDGWEVMARLKENPGLRHIPVHFISAAEGIQEAMQLGAVGFLSKPITLESAQAAFSKIKSIITKQVSRLLVVEDDKVQAESIKQLVGSGDVVTTIVSTGKKALEELETDEYDCMILDLGLEDMTGFDLLDILRSREHGITVPVIVYTGRDLVREEEEKLRKYTESIIVKGVKSPERLLEESAIFLHRVEANLPEHQIEKLRRVHPKDGVFLGKTILVVDDDMRNVFALTNLLEDKGVKIIVARDGFESLEKLALHREINLVLMDIMMPKMDGFVAMSRIREQPVHKDLPIIALTAKAMKGDRSKCIEAGANDYLAKPVNTDKLLSILKVWLY
ncbi:MAG: response regulator [Desulforhopalus sp.]